jgi:hypothetical protein
MRYAGLADAKAIADKLWADGKSGKLSKIGIDEIRAACGNPADWKNYRWLEAKVLRLTIMKVG